MIFRRLWPYLLGVVALAVMYLDRPIGLKAGLSPSRHGNWSVEGWMLDSGLPMALGILMLAASILAVFVQATNKTRS